MPSPCRLNLYEPLSLYDVSSPMNKYLTAIGTGAFHGGVEVYGKEYSFGYCGEVSGIFHNEPKGCTLHHFRESIELGECTKSEGEVEQMVEEMKPEWPGDQYDLIRRNCVIFSAEFARRLGVKPVPAWVTNLSGAGATIPDGAMQVAAAAQAAAIMAAAKAGEIDVKYDISGTATAKVGDILSAAGELDDKYQIKKKAGEAATRGAELAVQGAAWAQEVGKKYKVRENAAAAAVKGGQMVVDGAKHVVFKVGEMAEHHQVKEKVADLKEKATVNIHELDETHHITEKMRQNGCSVFAECTVQ